MATKQNYTLDTKKKIITATIEKLDTVEKEIVEMYLKAGYVLHKGKSNPWNKKTIMKWLADNVSKEEAEKFKSDCADKNIGWVKARKGFFEKYKKKIDDSKKKDDSTKIKEESK